MKTRKMTPEPPIQPRPATKAGYILAAIWIFGGALWFYIRFTIAFYTANKPSIDSALSRLLETLGLAP